MGKWVDPCIGQEVFGAGRASWQCFGMTAHGQRFRDFLSKLEEAGELLRIQEEVDWKFGIGEKTRSILGEKGRYPALLFLNVSGYPGHRIFINGLGNTPRIAIALGVDPRTPYKELVRIFRKRIQRPKPPLILNEAGPSYKKYVGDEVDLLRLPVPWWNRGDAGRYLGTWHLNISKDPETEVRNVGVYRMQLLGPREAAVSISPGSHLAMQIAKAEAKGRSLEMAVAIGVEETLVMAAGASIPYGQDEFAVAGGLGGIPVGLNRCQTIDLEVPASAEIVIEGNIVHGKRIKEGPFLDYAGIPKGNPHAYVFAVSCHWHRLDPIFRGALIGSPGAEDHVLYALLASAGCLDFHGSRWRQAIQNKLLRLGLFRPFQWTGSIRTILRQGALPKP